jgi:hypothetical protein
MKHSVMLTISLRQPQTFIKQPVRLRPIQWQPFILRKLTYIKGAVVGASLETMTDAIYRIERTMVVWQTRSRHEGQY